MFLEFANPDLQEGVVVAFRVRVQAYSLRAPGREALDVLLPVATRVMVVPHDYESNATHDRRMPFGFRANIPRPQPPIPRGLYAVDQ
jgi:hypothetical protein